MGRSSSASTSDPALEAERRRALNENIAAIRDRVGSTTEDIFRRYGIRRALGSSSGGSTTPARSTLSGPMGALAGIFQNLGARTGVNLGSLLGGALTRVGKAFGG